jgi:hypothetical protein
VPFSVVFSSKLFVGKLVLHVVLAPSLYSKQVSSGFSCGYFMGQGSTLKTVLFRYFLSLIKVSNYKVLLLKK